MSMAEEGSWTGRPLPRKEDARLLRGRGQFMADLHPFAGTREAAILRSPYAHARIRAIDYRAALEMPGVVGVLTGEEVRRLGRPLGVAAPVPQDYYPLAVDKARYVGEPVAVVVAHSRAQAEDALAQVRVDYEPLPAVVDSEVALRADAPILHETLGHNVAVDRTLRYGDPDAAFAAAAHVIAGTYRFPKISSTPIETYGIIANWEADDSATVYANFQGPFSMHPVMARSLNLPENRLRLIVPADIGGGFGVKISIYPYIVLMALASKHLGCPVRWIEDRLEALAASSSSADRVATVEAAVDADGHLLGLRMRLLDNVGAYIRAPEPGNLFRTTGNIVSGYRVRDLEVRAIAVMTNKCPTGPIRGYGVAPLYFALERLMDKIAAQLGLDPAEVRRRNLILPQEMPYRTPTGGFYDSGDYPATLEAALRRADYPALRQEQAEARRQGRWFGIGVAIGVDPAVSNMGYIDIVQPPANRQGGRSKSGAGEGAVVAIDPAGGVSVTLNTCAQGQGHETVAAQLVADVLGVSPEAVRVVAGMDTATRNWTIATGAYSSRFSATGAAAVAQAAQTLREKLVRLAAHLLEADPADIEWVDGQARVRGVPARALSLRQLAGTAHWDVQALPAGMEPGLVAESYVSPATLDVINAADQVNSSATYGFVADVLAVEIDRDTFEVHIRRYVTAHDIGRVLNPLLVEGQIYGATLHGLGAALLEEMAYDESGQLLTGTFMDYLLPSATEAPRLDIVHLGEPSPYTPLGAKGVGESTTETAPVVLANAVADALAPLGVEIDALPLSPDRLFRLVQGALGASA